MLFQRLRHRLKRFIRQRKFGIWYDAAYRLPITSLAPTVQLEPRRADYALWYLADIRAITPEQVKKPKRITFRDLARVHDHQYLESLNHAKTLGPYFYAEEWDIPTDEVIRTLRLACGGTLEGARFALHNNGVALNLLGGFHHASPNRGGPLCPLNDIAVAVETLRSDGFKGQVVVLDFDAHPPDGTEDCLGGKPNVWLGSISGTTWGPLPHTDETVLSDDASDAAYIQALRALLERMPEPDLAFVIAGGDVLADDHMGGLDLSLHGTRERDLILDNALAGVPSVWLPGGGYHKHSWKVLAGTGLILTTGSTQSIPKDYQPLATHYHSIASKFDPTLLPGMENEPLITEADFAEILGMPAQPDKQLFLGYYTAAAIEYGLFQYGLLDNVRRLGYDPLTVKVDKANEGDRFQLWGKFKGEDELLVELVAEKQLVDDKRVLYIHWLTMRHPKGIFNDNRPQLPGQKLPGLGLAKEAGELLKLMSIRLKLHGVAFQPAWFHIAYAMRRKFQFVSPERQGRFEALIRDTQEMPLKDTTLLIFHEQFLCNGEPYIWESGIMLVREEEYTEEEEQRKLEAFENTTFTLREGAHIPESLHEDPLHD